MEIFIAAEAGKLKKLKAPTWTDKPVVNVVMAAKGYPGKYKKGTKINGIENVEIENPDIVVFHAGTKRDEDGQLLSNGGRVLNVTAEGETIEAAVKKAYAAVEAIDWKDGFYRTDIAHHALKRS